MKLQNIFFLNFKEKLIIFEKGIASISLLLLLILVLTQIVLRNLFDYGISDIDVISRHLVLFITFMGAALACENSQHIKMDCVNSVINPNLKNKLKSPLLLASTLICSTFFWFALNFWLDEYQYAPNNEHLALYLALAIPIGFFVLSLHFFLLFVTLEQNKPST